MLKRTTCALILLGILFGQNTVFAQSYPWRVDANSDATTTRIQSKVVLPVPANPVAFQKLSDQEPDPLADAQPSVSDRLQSALPQAQNGAAPQLPAVSPPPAAPVEPTLIQSVQPMSVGAQSVVPGLTVQSNADATPANYCNRNCRKPCCLGCERKLFPQSCNGTQVGGWTTIGYHNRNNGLFNNHAGDVDIAQAWLYVDRQASRNQAGWDFGYRIDTLYGLDAQDTQAFGNAPTGAPSGWDNGWDFGRHGWALPQLYVQAANCDWDVKLGKFFSPFGYETIASPTNFFYSRSFTSFYTEPYTFTGILGERQLNATDSYVLGYTTGWDTGFENNSGGNLILGFRRNVNEFVRTSFTASAGDTGIRDTGTFTSSVTEIQLTNSLQYVFQADVANLRDNQEFGIVQYLFRDVNPCLGLGARLEWWKSDRFFGGATSSTYGFTMGANYRPNANVTLRPEVRWDWGAIAVDPGEAIIGIDAVVTF